MKILLINPPLGLLSIASTLKKGAACVRVDVLDAQAGTSSCRK